MRHFQVKLILYQVFVEGYKALEEVPDVGYIVLDVPVVV